MIKVNYESPEVIQQKASDFLKKYHLDLTLPVPIEEIISFDMGIDIIPIQGLKAVAEKTGLDIDAFYSHQDDSISVDKFIYDKRQTRYRLTLAHEIGHKILHGYIYEEVGFKMTSEYVDFINAMSMKERAKAEWQAYEFARRILIPKESLFEEFKKALEGVQEDTELCYDTNPGEVEDLAIKYYLKNKYNLSEMPIRIRLENEGMIDKRREDE